MSEELEDIILEKGKDLNGFVIKKLIGEGCMGHVYLAEQTSMKRDVAIKVLKKSITTDASAVEDFFKEAKTTGKLDHPNIVTAIDTGESDGHYYLVMNYIEGSTLEDLLEERDVFKEKEAINIVVKTAAALEYAWSKHKMIHKDIKPSNIMLDKYGDVFLMDMGVAQHIGENDEASSIIDGSPLYMSPEQANAKKLDWSSDLYSLGATLYNLIVGVPPFESDDIMEILKMHKTKSLPNPKDRNPDADVTAGCVVLLKRMLSKTKANRFDSWELFIKEAKRTVGGKKVLAKSSKATNAKRKEIRDQKKKKGNVKAITSLFIFSAVILISGYIGVKNFYNKPLKVKAKKFYLEAIATYIDDTTNEPKENLSVSEFRKILKKCKKAKKNYNKILLWPTLNSERESEEIKTNKDVMVTTIKAIKENIKLLKSDKEGFDLAIVTAKAFSKSRKYIEALKALEYFTENEEYNKKLDAEKALMKKWKEEWDANKRKRDAAITKRKELKQDNIDAKAAEEQAKLDDISENERWEQEKQQRATNMPLKIKAAQSKAANVIVKFGAQKSFNNMMSNLNLRQFATDAISTEEPETYKQAKNHDEWVSEVIKLAEGARDSWAEIRNSDKKYAGILDKKGTILKIENGQVILMNGGRKQPPQPVNILSKQSLESIFMKKGGDNCAFLAMSAKSFKIAKDLANDKKMKDLISLVATEYFIKVKEAAEKSPSKDLILSNLKKKYGTVQEYYKVIGH